MAWFLTAHVAVVENWVFLGSGTILVSGHLVDPWAAHSYTTWMLYGTISTPEGHGLPLPWRHLSTIRPRKQGNELGSSVVIQSGISWGPEYGYNWKWVWRCSDEGCIRKGPVNRSAKEGDAYCEVKMEKAEEGRNLERGGRHVKNKTWGWRYVTEKTKKKWYCSRQCWPERAKAIGPCSKCTKWVLSMAFCLQRRIWIIDVFDVLMITH